MLFGREGVTDRLWGGGELLTFSRVLAKLPIFGPSGADGDFVRSTLIGTIPHAVS